MYIQKYIDSICDVAWRYYSNTLINQKGSIECFINFTYPIEKFFYDSNKYDIEFYDYSISVTLNDGSIKDVFNDFGISVNKSFIAFMTQINNEKSFAEAKFNYLEKIVNDFPSEFM